MEMIGPIEMILADVDNNNIDYEIMDDHTQNFDSTPKNLDATRWKAVMQANGCSKSK